MAGILHGQSVILSDTSIKSIEDITYDDELLVWNFDEGKFDKAKPAWIKKAETADYYFKNTYRSGKKILTAGNSDSDPCYGHYNMTKNEFSHTLTTITDTIYTKDGPDEHMSCEKVYGKCEFYNIYTKKHFNYFVNGVLVSDYLNNFRQMKDMKFEYGPSYDEIRWQDFEHIADSLRLRGSIVKEFFRSLRLDEFPYERTEELKKYFTWLIVNDINYHEY